MFDEHLNKTYKLKTSENFDEFLKVLEIGLLGRKAATAVSPTLVFRKNADGSYTMSMFTPIKNTDTTFKLDEEFDETRADGAKVKSKFFLQDGKLVHTQVESNGRTSTHVREFSGNKLVTISTCDRWDGKCVRTYELVQ